MCSLCLHVIVLCAVQISKPVTDPDVAREINTMISLNHENILHLHDLVSAEGKTVSAELVLPLLLCDSDMMLCVGVSVYGDSFVPPRHYNPVHQALQVDIACPNHQVL